MAGTNVESWSSGTLFRVARGQRRILLIILLGLVVAVLYGVAVSSSVKSERDAQDAVLLGRLIGFGFGLVQLYFVWQLANALRSGAPWLYCVLGFVPIVALFSLFYLNQKATKVLQANGIRVGFLGADLASFGTVSFGPDECNLCGKYLKHADQVMECRKCDINVCESCADRTRESAGMIESFTLTCPKCENKLSEVRGQAAVVEEPAAEDFGDE